MPFDIERWKSKVTGAGLHRPYMYEMFIQPPNGQTELLFDRIEAISLPGAAYMSVDNHRPYGSGKVYNIPYVYNPQEITASYLVDANSDVIQTMFDWSSKITDLKGDDKFAAYYLFDYVGTMIIWLFDEDGKRVKTYNVKEAYPLSVDQVQLSWATTDEITRLTVQYRYTNYTVE